MPDKLNTRQIETLEALEHGERSAYPGLNMATLEALRKRGFVTCRYDRGSFSMPHNGIKWLLNDVGMEYLAAMRNKNGK